jgi:hypothetical protein
MSLTFETRVCGIPCLIEILNYQPFMSGHFSGLPEDCYPDEGGCGEWRVLSLKGKPASWLEKKMNREMRDNIDHEVYEHMESK